MRVFKYPLKEFLMLPKGARVIEVGVQEGHPRGNDGKFLWAIVDPEAEPEGRNFKIIATGEAIPEGASYLCSFAHGFLRWHVFEDLS